MSPGMNRYLAQENTIMARIREWTLPLLFVVVWMTAGTTAIVSAAGVSTFAKPKAPVYSSVAP
jgi:hypothetical protein